MRQIFTLLILATQVANCETIEVTESQDIAIQTGDTLVIKLKENPTTGYSWDMQLPQIGVVELQENEYVAPNNGLIGAGGIRRCVLKAKETGTAEITGTYRRPWEKNNPPAKCFKCTVTVKSAKSE